VDCLRGKNNIRLCRAARRGSVGVQIMALCRQVRDATE
jgi:hypothetical protein